jgi:hypothetical protein
MPAPTNPQTPTSLQALINDYEARECLKFSPTKDFYKNSGINRIRFWQLVKGKKELLVSEAQLLANFFNVPLSKLITNEKPGN